MKSEKEKGLTKRYPTLSGAIPTRIKDEREGNEEEGKAKSLEESAAFKKCAPAPSKRNDSR